MRLVEIIEASGIGLLAGVLGGLAGVGGSMIMIPGQGLVWGYPQEDTQHLYMASAMVVNVVVSLPAAVHHHRQGAVRLDLLRTLLPSTAVAIVIGVLLSNQFGGRSLRYGLAVFLVGYAVLNIRRVFVNRVVRPGEDRENPPAVPTGRLVICGAATGLVGGLLGLGGGVVLVPMLQMLCGVRLRQSIATSSAVMCVTAMIGASFKLATLAQVGQSASQGLLLAAIMAPTAFIGGRIGAGLTHTLPLTVVRALIALVLFVAASKLAGLY